MNEQLEEALADAVLAAEIRARRPFDIMTVYEVLKYSLRKLEVIGKGMDYLPLLYEDELVQYAERERINQRGELNRVCNLLEEPVRQPVPQRA